MYDYTIKARQEIVRNRGFVYTCIHSNVQLSINLLSTRTQSIVTPQRPAIQRNVRRRHVIRILHVLPLRVEQYPQGTRTGRQVHREDRYARVLLVRNEGLRHAGETDGVHGLERGTRWGVEHGDLEGLAVEFEGGGGAFGGYGRVGVHAPLDGLGGGDFVLDEDLATSVEEAGTTLNGGAEERGVSLVR